MLGSWFKNYRVKRKSLELLNSAKLILKKNSSVINPDTLRIANERIDAVEKSLSHGDLNEIDSSYSSLHNLVNKDLKPYIKSKLRQNIEALVIALCLALLIRTFIVQPFKIPSGSMIPTLLIGDHLLVNKFIYGTKVPLVDKVFFPVDVINRGDVIVFKFPANKGDTRKGVHYIKRVIGLPGDTINIKGRDILINGQKINQTYTGSYQYMDENGSITTDKYIQTLSSKDFDVIYRKGRTTTSKGKFGYPLTVPEDHVFVIGDNRDNSYDSRFWGFVPVKNISGKAFIIHWSWNFKNNDVLRKVRWDRIFTSIN